MCLLFIYFKPTFDPDQYKLILANNRDEYYHRPAKIAHFWPQENKVIGGTDEEKGKEGGTWLAISKNGKASCLLNILQPPSEVDPSKKGRGFLVNDFVQGHLTPKDYLKELEKISSEYNGFLLVTMDVFSEIPSVCYLSNKYEENVQSVEPGAYVFGNSSPKNLWAKAAQGKKKFDEVLKKWNNKSKEEQLVAGLMNILKDTTTYPVDEQIRKQGKGHPNSVLEKLNAAFYTIPEINYGTRSHSIILVDGENNVKYLESAMEQPINVSGDVRWVDIMEHFALEPTVP